VSNFAVAISRKRDPHLSRSDIASNQVRYNMLQREVEAESSPTANGRASRSSPGARSAKAWLTASTTNGKRPKDAFERRRICSATNLRAAAPLIRELRKTGRAHGKTPGQNRARLAAPQPKRHPDPWGEAPPSQAEENARAAGWSLSARELRTLGGLLRRIRLDTF